MASDRKAFIALKEQINGDKLLSASLKAAPVYVPSKSTPNRIFI